MSLALVVHHHPGYRPTTLGFLIVMAGLVLVTVGVKKVLSLLPGIKITSGALRLARALSGFLLLLIVSVGWTVWLHLHG